MILNLILGALSIMEAVSKMTKNTADDKLTGEISAAIVALQRVTGNPVYKSQLEKIEARW